MVVTTYFGAAAGELPMQASELAEVVSRTAGVRQVLPAVAGVSRAYYVMNRATCVMARNDFSGA